MGLLKYLICSIMLVFFASCSNEKDTLPEIKHLDTLLSRYASDYESYVYGSTLKHILFFFKVNEGPKQLELRFSKDDTRGSSYYITISGANLRIERDGHLLSFKGFRGKNMRCPILHSFSAKQENDEGMGNSVSRCDSTFTFSVTDTTYVDSIYNSLVEIKQLLGK